MQQSNVFGGSADITEVIRSHLAASLDERAWVPSVGAEDHSFITTNGILLAAEKQHKYIYIRNSQVGATRLELLRLWKIKRS